MKLIKSIAILIALSTTLIGCGRIETGEVGVRTEVNKKVETEEVPQGFYVAFLSSVDQFSIKEIPIELNDLTPKAKDNLSLRDFDVTVYYSTASNKVAELYIKYQNQHEWNAEGGVYLPAYRLVYGLVRGAAYDSIAQFDSLTIHTKRNDLEDKIKTRVQADLDQAEPETFKVTRVVIRQVLTDPSIEESIQKAVQVEKAIEAKNKEVDLAKAEAARKREEAQGTADYNRKIAESLSDKLLQYKQLEVQEKFAGAGTHTVIMPSNTPALINLK